MYVFLHKKTNHARLCVGTSCGLPALLCPRDVFVGVMKKVRQDRDSVYQGLFANDTGVERSRVSYRRCPDPPQDPHVEAVAAPRPPMPTVPVPLQREQMLSAFAAASRLLSSSDLNISPPWVNRILPLGGGSISGGVACGPERFGQVQGGSGAIATDYTVLSYTFRDHTVVMTGIEPAPRTGWYALFH